jgi:membrane protein required for colicin V production
MAGFAALGIVNKLLGGAFGLLKMAFLASVVIMFFGATNEEIDLVSEESLEESKLYAPVKTIAPAVLPSIIREARERDILNEENDFFKNEKEEV